MKLLIIPSWYPSNIHPESGTFFRERALILQRHGFNITIAAHIVHSARDVLKFKPDPNDNMPVSDNEMIVYKTEALNPAVIASTSATPKVSTSLDNTST